MENIKIASVCGLCMGCKNAITIAKEASKTKHVVLFKEIVHNKNINFNLKLQGIECVDSLDKINKNDTIIIRAHGEPPETYKTLKDNNIEFLDGTCKNVKNIHNIVSEYSKQNFKIIITGKYGKHNGIIHPETLGIIGYCETDPILIEDYDDIKKIDSLTNTKFLLVSQTTFNPNKFEYIKESISLICKKNNNELIIKNTICGAQIAIQNSSLSLANESDLMIVVGGKNSSNTIELFNNIKNICSAIHIENINDYKKELELINFKISKNTKIGITAGASTDKNELLVLKENLEKEYKLI